MYDLSGFDNVLRVISEETISNGGFYKLKSYADAVSVPLSGSVEALFSQSAQNSRLGSSLIKRRIGLTERINDFVRDAQNQVNAFLRLITSELKEEVLVFAEANYKNKNASKEWNKIVESKDIQQRAQLLIENLSRRCENELKEICRETEFDIKYMHHFDAIPAFKVHRLVNGRRVWNWAINIVSGGLTIVGLIFVPPLIGVGIGVGAFGWLGKLLFRDYESKAEEARKDLECRLNGYIDNMINGLEKTLNTVVMDGLVRKQLRQVEWKINDTVRSLFALSDVQKSFAVRMNGKLREINRMIVTEALAYKGFQGLEYHINSLARIPGFATMIVIDDGKRFPEESKMALMFLMKEHIWFIFQNNSLKSMVMQAIGKNCDYNAVRIQMIKGNPAIVHIPMIENVDVQTMKRILMAQQLTELLIMK